LNDVVNGRKTPYTALLETAQSFATLIPDSNTRFKAAFVSLKRPADDIVKSIDVHIADVDAQLVSFNGRAQAELQAKSGSLREQAAMLGRDTEAAKTQIAAIDAQRAQLIQKITDNQGTAATLDAQANSAEADIKGTMSRFEATVNAKKQELLGQKQTLSTLLN
jgi:chromosome segregation ATPase